MSQITAYMGKPGNVGWCNGCTKQPPYSGDVCVVKVRSMEVRLCPECVQHLQGLFTNLVSMRDRIRAAKPLFTKAEREAAKAHLPAHVFQGSIGPV